jgi:hypothetical protein
MLHGKGMLVELSVDEIEIDINNPRIAHYIEIYSGELTAEQISLALTVGNPNKMDSIGGTSFRSLKESIKANRGIINPIIVNRVGDKKTVVEGNTRLKIYHDFRTRESGKEDYDDAWDSIMALVYDNLGQESIDAIRLQAHLVGPREWDPYSKAKYLAMLYNNELIPRSKLVDFCGGSERRVKDYIDAYDDMETYYRPQLEDESQFDAKQFSGFIELEKKSIQSSLIENGFSKRNFAKWLIDGKLKPLTLIRRLPKILSDSEAQELFKKKGAREADNFLIAKSTGEMDLNQAGLIQLIDAITEKIGTIPFLELQSMKGNENDILSVQSLLGVVESLLDIIDEGD